jgi:hypothetical protein
MTETEEPLIESLVGWNISNPDEYLQGNPGTAAPAQEVDGR